MPKNLEQKELFVLELSSVLTVLYAIIGIFMAVACDSMTLLLDALYGMADVVISIAAVIAVRKIHQPPDERYHYGYAKFEPLLQGIDGILILSVCVVAIITSVQDLIHAESMANLRLAVVYSFVSIFVCIGFGLYMKRVAKQTHSEVLKADSQLWVVEGVISLGVFLAFTAGLFIERTHWAKYTDYVDPALCILLSLILVHKPLKILGESLFDLVDRSPGSDTIKSVKEQISNIVKNAHLGGVGWIKLRRAGRRLFVNLSINVGRDESLPNLEKIRQDIISLLKKETADSDIFIEFH